MKKKSDEYLDSGLDFLKKNDQIIEEKQIWKAFKKADNILTSRNYMRAIEIYEKCIV